MIVSKCAFSVQNIEEKICDHVTFLNFTNNILRFVFRLVFFLSLVLFPLQLGYILDILSPSSFFDGGLIKVHEENHALVVVSGG